MLLLYNTKVKTMIQTGAMIVTTRNFILFTALTLLLAACGGADGDSSNENAGGNMSSGSGDNPLMGRIDADTAMILANLEPLPDDVLDQLWQPMEAMSASNLDTYDQMSDEVKAESPVVAALMKEFSTIDDRESLEALGIHSNGYWAMHMVSVYPMMHFELSDRAAFEAMLERVSTNSETDFPTREIDGEEIIWVAEDEMGIAIHHDERFATLAVVPDDLSLLRRVAGLDQANRPFDSGSLADFNRQLGYVAHGSGFVNLQVIFNQLMDSNNSNAAPARVAMELDGLVNNEACLNEMDSLLTLFPRMTMGLTELNENKFDMEFVVEAEDDMAQRLSAIADTPVGLSDTGTQTFSGGIAFDVVGARNFAREVVDNWVASPPECELFSNIAQNATEWQRALNQPIPPVVTNISGLRVNIDNFVMGDDGQVADAAGTLALFVRNPQMLLGMAQMFSPELASLGVEPNGAPKPLPAGLIPNMPDLGAFVALSDDAIGLSVGEGQQDNLPSALSGSEPDGTVLAYTINYGGYAEFMDKMMSGFNATQDAGDDELPPTDFLGQIGDLYDTTSLAIKLTERGIVIESDVVMKQ